VRGGADSLRSPFPAVPRPAGDPVGSPVSAAGESRDAPGFPGESVVLAEVLKRLEYLASENGKLRALTEVAESTEQRLSDELHRVRAELTTTQVQLTAEAPRRRWWHRNDRGSLPEPGSSA